MSDETGDGGGAATLVTIVIAVSDCAEFLPQAVESAISQTHPRVEVLVVDARERSIPRTIGERVAFPELSTLLGGLADRVSLHQQTNGGIACARNLGLAAARGEFLLFVGGEDRLEPGAVAQMVGAIERSGLSWVCANRSPVVPCGAPSDREAARPSAGGTAARPDPPDPVVLLVRKAALRTIGGFDERGLCDEGRDQRTRLVHAFPTHAMNAVVARRLSPPSAAAVAPTGDGICDVCQRLAAGRGSPDDSLGLETRRPGT